MFNQSFIFSLIGGLGFFFFGMQFMSDGLKHIAGDRIKNILHMATKVPIVGILVGTFVTCLMQSSSATTVMVVGFVNAGLLALKQAICVIMGANIGTTMTAWIVSSISVFKITDYALPAVGIGFLLMRFGKTKKSRFWGQVMLGFGLLFLGLSFMKDAFDPLKESQQVKHIFATLSQNPLLGVLVGVMFTIILQSSSATIAIVQVLALNGVIGFEAALPIVLGDNIGTTITAQMAALDGNLSAKRAAMAHTLFNIIGVTYMMFFVYNGFYIRAVDSVIPGPITAANIMVHIALAHTMFNITNTVIFYPFIGWLEKASVWLVPSKKGIIETGTRYLEKHLLDTPPIALEQAKRETARMLDLASSSVEAAVKSFINNNTDAAKIVPAIEETVDTLQSEITQYLIELSQRELDPEVTEMLPVLIHTVNDIERICDQSENILEISERRFEEKLDLSEEALHEVKRIWYELQAMILETRQALTKSDIELAKSVLRREMVVNKLQEGLKKGHVERLNQGVCQLKSGVVFLDLVDIIEKIGDHLTNIAQGIIGHMRWQMPKASAPSSR